MKKLILASQSKQRSALLKILGVPFEVVPADLDEKSIDHHDHPERAKQVAQAKVDKIRNQFPEAVIIAADTFVLLDGKRLEKPETKAIAREMLKTMSGKDMLVITGWVYSDSYSDIYRIENTLTRITFRTLLAEEIDRFVDQYPVTTWAGAFTLSNDHGMSLVATVDGSLTNIQGLPIEEIVPLLQQSNLL